MLRTPELSVIDSTQCGTFLDFFFFLPLMSHCQDCCLSGFIVCCLFLLPAFEAIGRRLTERMWFQSRESRFHFTCMGKQAVRSRAKTRNNRAALSLAPINMLPTSLFCFNSLGLPPHLPLKHASSIHIKIGFTFPLLKYRCHSPLPRAAVCCTMLLWIGLVIWLSIQYA